MNADRDSFQPGGGCWCPGEMSLYRLRFEGHTKECTTARRGWAANYRHMSEIDRQRRSDQALGEALRRDVLAVLAQGEAEDSPPLKIGERSSD